MIDLPPEITEGVAQLIRMVCNKENGYRWHTTTVIGDLNYRVKIELQQVDPEKEAKIATIIIRREDDAN